MFSKGHWKQKKLLKSFIKEIIDEHDWSHIEMKLAPDELVDYAKKFNIINNQDHLFDKFQITVWVIKDDILISSVDETKIDSFVEDLYKQYDNRNKKNFMIDNKYSKLLDEKLLSDFKKQYS